MADQSRNMAIRTAANNNGGVPLTDILYRTLHYWPWVLLSVFVCVGAGVAYLLCTPKVYTTTASILIKDDTSGKTAGVEDFGDFGLFQNKTNIQNEVTTLKSPDMMEEVVRRLGLDMNYYLPGRFHRVVAYGSNLPVTVSMPGFPDNLGASFEVEVSADGNISVSDLKSEDLEYDNVFKGTLNDTIRTEIGPIVVIPTPEYVSGEA